ncbi:MAG: aldehyde dehydrogenase family protein [Gammaproteobacteria bacterium]|nr:aldehyde dehydrogenase family protein [Gammaproteobacteria bacterium]TVQ45001.1 MAG: aldehyde dehydrogenase family protein [Gammaproteobacteria bacterium]
MHDYRKFYINGEWVDPLAPKTLEVINPATETPAGMISIGSAADVDRAVAAAREAFESYSQSTRDERIALLEALEQAYKARFNDIAMAISDEMGAPVSLAMQAQAATGIGHIKTYINILKDYAFEEDRGKLRIAREPIGVCGFITPWNWPINQIACKVLPALAAGCTMVLKPSEVAPINAAIFAEAIDAAGIPAGVFNLVNGDGPGVGAAIAAHPGIDMVSFTGSTRAGVQVAKAAADTVKRVAQELGGKSPNILLPDCDFQKAVAAGLQGVLINSGQSCNAPTRMLVPADRMDEIAAIARALCDKAVVGDPKAEGTQLGPVVSEVQWQKIQGLIQQGIDEGATLVCGGPGRPDGLSHGYYVKPTVFANVRNDMTIAREEIFGPVLCILPYADVDEAVRIANDTVYGLSAYVSGGDLDAARRVAARLRAGNVHINGAGMDLMAPFGGYKQSGNGREWGEYGLEEFLEVKAMLGYAA